MTTALEKVVNAAFAFVEKGRRPWVVALLEEERKALNGATMIAMEEYLRSVGLGWVAAGPETSEVRAAQEWQPASRVIHVINQSSVVNDKDFLAGVAAIQKQITEDYAFSWGGLSAVLLPDSARQGDPINPAGETVYLLDDSDQADALGYHELTSADVPVGFCFARTSEADGSPWSVTLSHELLEQLADPYVQTCVVASSFLGGPAVVAYETADPVEQGTYSVNGVAVSNFVFPAWFQDNAPAGARMDFLGQLDKPLSLARGGYVAWTRDLMNWQQFMKENVRETKRAILPYTRRFLRFWKGRSVPKADNSPKWVTDLLTTGEFLGIHSKLMRPLISSITEKEGAMLQAALDQAARW